MKWLDLFSGIGAYALGLEQAGHEVIGFCENEVWARKILKRHWPTRPISWDIISLNTALTALLGASRAKTSVLLAKEPALPESVQDSGGRWFEPFAWYDQSSSSWRTWQRCLVGGWGLFSETWPRAGMIRNGVAYRLLTSERRICENESILLPTPTVCGNFNRKGASKKSGDGLITRLKNIYMLPTIVASEGKGSSRDRYIGSQNFRGAKMSEGLRTTSSCPIYLNPCFAEKVMGLPKDFTALETQIPQQLSSNSRED